jgi:hemoglobin-like flavoprotein
VITTSIGPTREKVLHALLLTLAEFLGEDFTPDAARAWRTVYGKIAETMIEAGEPPATLARRGVALLQAW